MGFVFYAWHVLALLSMSNCSHCWRHKRSTESNILWPRMVALYGLVFRGFGFACRGTLTSQAAYSYTYISQDRKAVGKSSFLNPFCHAVLPSFDLRLQRSKLCLVKAFPWCQVSYFCPSPWACTVYSLSPSNHGIGLVPCCGWCWGMFGRQALHFYFAWVSQGCFGNCSLSWAAFRRGIRQGKRRKPWQRKSFALGSKDRVFSEVDMQHPFNRCWVLQGQD